MACRSRLDKLLSRYSLALASVSREKAALKEARARAEILEAAQRIIQEVAEAVEGSAHRQIAAVANRCLAAVFDEPYQLAIRFKKARGKTEAVLVLERDGLELDDPLNSAGGGVIAVASFALRLACLLLGTPRRRLFLALDESFSFLHSAEYRERVREMLEMLSEELGLQILHVTQDDSDLRIGKVVEMP